MQTQLVQEEKKMNQQQMQKMEQLIQQQQQQVRPGPVPADPGAHADWWGTLIFLWGFWPFFRA